MNAHERRILSRMAKRKGTAILVEPGDRPKDQKDSQANNLDRKGKDKGQGQPRTQTGRAVRIAKRTAQVIGTTIGYSVAILGLVSGYVALEPRVSVSQNEQLDPSDPFSSPFIVSNDGPLPMERVQFRCGILNANYGTGMKVQGDTNSGSSFVFLPDETGHLPIQNFGAVEMNPGERSTIPSCNYPFPKSIEGANIGIVVDFRIGYTPITTERIFRFNTLPDTSKKLHWYPLPIK